VSSDVTFAEMDVDSLALVEFSLMIEKEFGVVLGEDDLTADLTVTDVVDLVVGRKASHR
jgi:acyl carrier protein